MKQLLCIVCLSVLAIGRLAGAEDKPRVEFRESERIVFVGNEFFERDQDRCYIEAELTTRFHDKSLSFRNLGYSGDTVRADARNLCAGWANFGPDDQGFGRLKNLIENIKPTLIFVAYGMNESFQGEKGIDPFVSGLNRMLDMLASGGARVVLISPIRHEDLGRPLPDPTEHNKNLTTYIAAMEKVAQQRNYPFINLFEALGDGTKDSLHQAFTFDGIHLTPYGYWRAALVLENAMGYAPRSWRVELGKADVAHAAGANVSVQHPGNQSVADFKATDAMLPLAPPPSDAPEALRSGKVSLAGQERVLQMTGLPAGERFTLTSGSITLATATGQEWGRGVQLTAGPEYQQEERLRELIVAKNFDFFNFWRPDNDTYIFGYRQHEQGRNAVEVPRFIPLVEAKEQQIAQLRKPAEVTYTLTPAAR